ncbi:MAG TPA: hypothetical protein VFS40_14200 [Gemmatimonadales bacterium]|nr:hypothetical protein [Gemmatimonadales bacterium]
MRRLVPVGLALGMLLAGAACRKAAAPAHEGQSTAAAAGDPPAADPAAQAAADTLGRELFRLVDRAVSYRGAHRDRPARSVSELGLDSLSPQVVRRLALADSGGDGVIGREVATVAWRRPEGRALRSCRATPQVLEDAALQTGRFTVHCTLAAGGERAFVVVPAGAGRGARR